MKEEKRVKALAEQCLRESYMQRPEQVWMNDVCGQFMRSHEIRRKSELDQVLYERIYASSPSSSGILKVRYWRTGRHAPARREECELLGKALDLDPVQYRYLLQMYFDRCDLVFPLKTCGGREQEESHLEPIRHGSACMSDITVAKTAVIEEERPFMDTESETYLKRCALMNALTDEYLKRAHPDRLKKLGIRPHALKKNLRHLYFADSLCYIVPGKSILYRTDSASFDPEFRRLMRLRGEISRRTMLRHLILLGNPFLNRRILSERLQYFGFCPLDPGHTGTQGERTDALVCGLLDIYEEVCAGEDIMDCTRWFQEACRIADQVFVETRNARMRFMYYKALSVK